MPPLRCLVVELPTALAQDLTQRLTALGVHVAAADASTVVDSLVTAPPDVAIVNLALSHGSGFGLVNRVLHMEALAGLKIVLAADDATPDVLDAHRQGPTPAAAYVRRTEGSSDAALAADVLAAVHGLLAHHLPEMDSGDLVEVEREDATGELDPLAVVIAALGYRVLRRLRDEEGGAVFACMDDELHRAVAIKLMAPASAGDDGERLLRFLRERRILALLHSPHIGE